MKGEKRTDGGSANCPSERRDAIDPVRVSARNPAQILPPGANSIDAPVPADGCRFGHQRHTGVAFAGMDEIRAQERRARTRDRAIGIVPAGMAILQIALIAALRQSVGFFLSPGLCPGINLPTPMVCFVKSPAWGRSGRGLSRNNCRGRLHSTGRCCLAGRFNATGRLNATG